jgi:hypothetical protein
MKSNRFMSWIFRVMGLVLLVATIRCVAIFPRPYHAPAEAYFTLSACLFFSFCLLFGGFNFKRLCIITGAFAVFSLLGLDLAKWRDGIQSLKDVFITWGIVGSFLAFTCSGDDHERIKMPSHKKLGV